MTSVVFQRGPLRLRFATLGATKSPFLCGTLSCHETAACLVSAWADLSDCKLTGERPMRGIRIGSAHFELDALEIDIVRAFFEPAQEVAT